jgi:protein-S-isoprenylcysteine O-methyltransferase Ste14
MARPTPDTPGVIAWPPLLYGGTLALGLLAHRLRPVRPLPPLPARVAGAALVVVAGLWARWGEATMRRAGTNVRPDQPSLAIVTDGPFRHSRNPLYLGLTGLYAGTALLANALWPLVLLVPLLGVVQEGVVRREERYLAAKFGAPYLAYQMRVRRWL